MIRDTKTLLAYEAKKRPNLQSLINRLPNVTDEEIEKSGLIKWIRQALYKIKKDNQEKIKNQKISNDIEKFIVDGHIPDPLGNMYRWTGPDMFIQIERGNMLEVRNNSLIWLPIKGGIWIENLFCRFIDPKVLINSKLIKLISKSEYTNFYKSEQLSLMSLDATVIMTSKDANNTLAIYGVRFG